MSDPWRLVDDLGGGLDAAEQMAADVALLDEVAAGALPALRLYRWSPPALSLGRFQPDDDVDSVACRHYGVEVVRRPTGGRALLHGADLTYAVAMPLTAVGPARDSVDARYRLVAGALVAGLAELGVDAAVARTGGAPGPVCFAGQQGADLRVGERKLCGSAQLCRDGAVLQHGAILLDRLEFDETDVLRGTDPGVARERLRAATVTLHELGAPVAPRLVAGALVRGFERSLDVRFNSRLEVEG
ncbi:MAG TPA: biotin/lipoate A/B protein ligase family protein [Acidimicrobiia bacterium]